MHATGQRGMALLMAMLIAVTAAVSGTALAVKHHSGLARTERALDLERVHLQARAVEARVAGALAFGRATGSPEPGLVVEDAQGRFNLTNLTEDGVTSEADLGRFRRLLRALELPPAVGDAAADWMDADQIPGAAGAEDDFYLGLRPPYRTPGRPMVHPEELRFVAGVTAEVYRRLAPYVAALPVRTPINVNAASAPVLVAVVEHLGGRGAARLVAARPPGGYASLNAFLASPAMAGTSIDRDAVTVGSRFYVVHEQLRAGGVRAEAHSLVTWVPGGGVAVVRQSVQVR